MAPIERFESRNRCVGGVHTYAKPHDSGGIPEPSD